MKYKRLAVDCNFAKLVKKKASEKGKSIIDFTKELADEEDKIINKQIKPITKNFWRIL